MFKMYLNRTQLNSKETILIVETVTYWNRSYHRSGEVIFKLLLLTQMETKAPFLSFSFSASIQPSSFSTEVSFTVDKPSNQINHYTTERSWQN